MDIEENYDFIFKFIVIGDVNVGKTSLLKRFCNKEFDGELRTTIGVDFKVCKLLSDFLTHRISA